MKKITTIAVATALLVLAACSTENATPEADAAVEGAAPAADAAVITVEGATVQPK